MNIGKRNKERIRRGMNESMRVTILCQRRKKMAGFGCRVRMKEKQHETNTERIKENRAKRDHFRVRDGEKSIKRED